MKIGLIGVGVMGEPMAKNLKKAGHGVTVYSRTPGRCDALRPLGIEVARTSGQVFDVQQFLDMAQAGPLANDVLRSKVAKLVSDDFAQQAPIRHVAKDIGLVCDEAQQRGVWLPIAEANRTLFSQAMLAGQSQDDAIGIVKILRRGP